MKTKKQLLERQLLLLIGFFVTLPNQDKRKNTIESSINNLRQQLAAIQRA